MERISYRKQRLVKVNTTITYSEGDGRPFAKENSFISTGDFLDSEASLDYTQITQHQGRSITDERVRNKVIWADEDRVLYGARDRKGSLMCDFANLNVEIDGEPPDGVMVHGLKDGRDLDRLVRVSRVVRGILPAEKPASIEKIEEVVYEGEKMPIKDAIEGYLIRKKAEVAQNDVKADRDNFLIVQKYLRKHDFYIVERDLQVSERFRDLINFGSVDELKKSLSEIFGWLNTAFKVNKGGLITGTAAPASFDASKADIERYFVSWLPEQMGTYLGRLHKNGIIHGSPTDQNWSAVGTLYDWDGARGEIFGDEPLSDAEYSKEVSDVIMHLFHGVLGMKYFNLSEVVVWGEDDKRPVNQLSTFLDLKGSQIDGTKVIFAAAYIKERFGITKPAEFEEVWNEHFPLGYYLSTHPKFGPNSKGYLEFENEARDAWLGFKSMVRQNMGIAELEIPKVELIPHPLDAKTPKVFREIFDTAVNADASVNFVQKFRAKRTARKFLDLINLPSVKVKDAAWRLTNRLIITSRDEPNSKLRIELTPWNDLYNPELNSFFVDFDLTRNGLGVELALYYDIDGKMTGGQFKKVESSQKGDWYEVDDGNRTIFGRDGKIDEFSTLQGNKITDKSQIDVMSIVSFITSYNEDFADDPNYADLLAKFLS